MLIASLLPLLGRYSLGLDLVAGPDDVVTLTIIPRKSEGAGAKLESVEVRPISITATAEEIDAELARGMHGALCQLFVARKALGDQLAEQQAAAAAAAKPKAKPAAPTANPAPANPANAAPAEPAGPTSLW